jgi:mono/diheme cytochrome c family protein
MLVRPLSLLLLSVAFIFFQNCSSAFHSMNDSLSSSASATGGPAGQTLVIDPTLNSQAIAILTTNCATCHESATNGGVTQILDVNHLIATGIIVPGSPMQGSLISAIQTGGMPVGGMLAAADLTTLENWISSMHYVAGAPSPTSTPVSPLPPGKVVIADSTLHNQAMQVLNVNCAGCHMADALGGINYILDINQLVANGLVVAGDSTQGALLAQIAAGTMPQGNGARVTAADLQTLKSWINSMTIVDQSVFPTPLPTRHALDDTFSGVFANVIQPKCLACHGPVKSTEFDLNSYTAVKSNSSDILSNCQSKNMPQSPYPSVSADELTVLQGWIKAGMLNN